MFGVPAFPPPVTTVDEVEFETVAEPKTEDETLKELNGSDVAASLLSEKVLVFLSIIYYIYICVYIERERQSEFNVLLSWFQVLAKQQGSWRDRARKQGN